MEYPGAWTLLVSSLSVADLDDPQRTWRFLSTQKLVVESATGPDQLRQAIASERARGRITGGSLALRVSEHLVNAALTEPAASNSDPFGKVAAARWKAFAS